MNMVEVEGEGTAMWKDTSGTGSWSELEDSAWVSADSDTSEEGFDCSEEDFFAAFGILSTGL